MANDSRTPLYKKMYQELRARIEKGTFPEGGQLPTEQELASEFQVSRGTARHAISRLVQDGAVERTAGRGTFVLSRRLVYSARELLGFTGHIRASGRVPSSEVIDVSVIDAAENTHGTEFGADVESLLSIERVRKADGEPVALEHLLLPLPRFAGLKDVPLEKVSIYDTLEEQFGIRLGVGEFTLNIADINNRQAGLLAENPGASAFLMSGTVIDEDSRPAVAVRCYYRSGKYSFSFSIPRETHVAARSVRPRLMLSL